MLPIVEIEQADFIINKINSEPCLVVPIYLDITKHPKLNSISVLFVFMIGTDELYIFPFNHNEAVNLPLEYLEKFNPMKMIVEHKEDLLYFIDKGNLINYKNGQVTIPKVMEETYLKFNRFKNINRTIPIMKLIEYATSIKEKILNDMASIKSNSVTDNIIIPVLHFIEKYGLRVDETELIKYFGTSVLEYVDNGFVYSKYNIDTTTGRPSNAFGHINFAALNKKDGTRKSFVSRFDNGQLILIDFESFHLRLIADLVGYPQPQIPFHEYLAKLYYKTNNITQQQYDEGKQLTFSYLYGEIPPKIDIPFFSITNKWISNMWNIACKEGSLTLKTDIDVNISAEINKQKLFNYIIQAEETVTALSLINKLIPLYNNSDSKIILYTYDSILIDHAVNEGNDIIFETASLLEDSGRFPTRIYSGKNYHEMLKIR